MWFHERIHSWVWISHHFIRPTVQFLLENQYTVIYLFKVQFAFLAPDCMGSGNQLRYYWCTNNPAANRETWFRNLRPLISSSCYNFGTQSTRKVEFQALTIIHQWRSTEAFRKQLYHQPWNVSKWLLFCWLKTMFDLKLAPNENIYN